ncbi:MAG: hypothetical protein MUC51_12505 [Anaerolineae bacterium]|nr:hypothetical protein [Anaerolineae bacterium]
MSPARKAARTRRRTKYASSQARPPTRRGPWLSGSFYLVAMLVIGALVVIAARLVHPAALPVVILGAVLAVSVVGILQLVQDGKLSERTFASLLGYVLRSIAWFTAKLRRPPRSEPDEASRRSSNQDAP